MLQKIHDSHGKALWALIAAYAIFGIIMLFAPRFHIRGMEQVSSNLLISILTLGASVLLAVVAIHLLFGNAARNQGSIFTALGPIDPGEKAEFDTDVTVYEKVRKVVGDVLTVIGLAITAYVLYRIVGVVPIVLSALGWKSESLTNILGNSGTTAISVLIGVASLIFWFVALNFVFRKLEAKPG